jgi:alcohol dehydrogenase
MAIPNEFNISTRIIYGKQSAARIGEIASGLNLKNIQLVTDKGVANSGTLDFLLKSLEDAGINSIIYDDVVYNPTVQTVDKAAEQFRNEKCDGVIAVGGGSPIDAGKCVGVLATNPGSAIDYLGVDMIKNPAVPVICVPTTAGTAAEITDVAVLNDPETEGRDAQPACGSFCGPAGPDAHADVAPGTDPRFRS